MRGRCLIARSNSEPTLQSSNCGVAISFFELRCTGTCGRSQEHQVNAACDQRTQQVHVACQSIELGEHHSSPNGLCVPQGSNELGTITSLPALCLNVFGDKLPATAVEIARHRFPLRLHAEATAALLVRLTRK